MSGYSVDVRGREKKNLAHGIISQVPNSFQTASKRRPTKTPAAAIPALNVPAIAGCFGRILFGRASSCLSAQRSWLKQPPDQVTATCDTPSELRSGAHFPTLPLPVILARPLHHPPKTSRCSSSPTRVYPSAVDLQHTVDAPARP